MIPDRDDAHRVLASSRRREILNALTGRDRIEYPDEITFRDHVDLDEIRVMMHHSHLPMLAEHEYIEWDPDAQEIARGPNFENIRPLLQPKTEVL